MCSSPPMAWWWCIMISSSIPAMRAGMARCSKARRPGSRICDYARAHPALQAEEGARIPSLAEVAALSGDFLLLVELKSSTDPGSADPVALADAALKVMQDQLHRTVFVGFDWRGLARVKQVSPDARCWFTTDTLSGDARPVLDLIKASDGDGWFPNFPDATADMTKEARARGLQVAAWTVNEPDDMRRLIGQGLDAICTDRPDLLKTLEQGS
jgi:glycerophosphoryl diester phosphodiesterase